MPKDYGTGTVPASTSRVQKDGTTYEYGGYAVSFEVAENGKIFGRGGPDPQNGANQRAAIDKAAGE